MGYPKWQAVDIIANRSAHVFRLINVPCVCVHEDPCGMCLRFSQTNALVAVWSYLLAPQKCRETVTPRVLASNFIDTCSHTNDFLLNLKTRQFCEENP